MDVFKKALFLHTELTRHDLWRPLERHEIRPAIFVTHDELMELKTNPTYFAFFGHNSRNLRAYGIYVCEEE
jgi:hypothetical protein